MFDRSLSILSLEIVPWAQITLLVAIFGAISDRTVKWVPNTENKIFAVFIIIVVLSSLFAFRPSRVMERENRSY